MIIKTTETQIIISFEKRDIGPKQRDYNPLNKEWTLTRFGDVDAVWAEIHKRHDFDPNQRTMFAMFDQQQVAA